ncbi:THUMP domain-containing protein 3-like [Gigantopelta aegis]|uniref:THUMP domain-containing protein 3-like n=1 Tax=Gigantopelta aegis TaxID=1735272 RepID=UPI001B889C26|nr:THUMP domain-containing protein 3-like [Gigantopelta aegis]
MAAPSDDMMDKENVPEFVEIEATVATGFEQTARDEAEEKLGAELRTGRGKIIMRLPLNDAFKVLNLGCIDNIRVVMTTKKNFEFSRNELECMRRLREIVRDVEWDSGLRVWGKVYTFAHPIAAVPDEIPESLGEPFIVSRERQPKKQKDKKVNKDKFQNRQKEKEQNRKQKETKKPKAKVEDGKGEALEAGDAVAGQFDDVENDQGKAGSAAGGECGDGAGDKTEDITAAETPGEVSSVEDVKLQEVSEGKEEQSVAMEEEDATVPEEKNPEEKDTVLPGEENTKLPEEKNATVVDQDSKTGEPSTEDDNINCVPTKSAQDEDKESQPESSATGMDDSQEAPEQKKKKVDPTKPTFRVTCNRTGEGHSFDSMCAAANFGDAVQTYFGWNVDMKNFDIEVILNIEDRDVSVGIGLTKQSLHRRNLSSFGPTTLRPTIAYNMLRLCKIHPGDVVCDPMCGSGSIPIQSAISWPWGYHLSGDNFPKACERTLENIGSLNTLYKEQNKRPISLDVMQWDVCNMPLRDSSVDIFITDLPFGKRMGSKFNNMNLYPAALTEMARVCRPGWGRACFLTVDKKCMIKTMQSMVIRRYWQRRMILGINLGGLAAGVFLLTRTDFPFISETPWPSVSDASKKTSDKPVEQSTPNSKQMSAERMAAIRMAQNLTNRPWKKPSESASSENKKTYVMQRPQADYRLEENNMRTKPTSNNQPASAGDDDITELKSSSEAVCDADKELMESNSKPATEAEVEKP